MDDLERWQMGIGSKQRYTPHWWDRNAYRQGLLDANRIGYEVKWSHPDRKVSWPLLSGVMRAIWERAEQFRKPGEF